MEEKTFEIVDQTSLKEKILDVEVFGEDVWQLICKASSKKQGWMKSTKAMEIPGVGCLVQATTQQLNPNGTYSIAEALTFVPGTTINILAYGMNGVISREIAKVGKKK